jgi:hypothetical protein
MGGGGRDTKSEGTLTDGQPPPLPPDPDPLAAKHGTLLLGSPRVGHKATAC